MKAESNPKRYIKSEMTPEAWEARMQRQREWRAKPGVMERRRARDRELWPTSRAKAISAEKERARRAAGKCAAIEARRRAKAAADPVIKARRSACSMACYRKKREHYKARGAEYRNEVSPCYAANLLKLPVAIIPPEVIETVRAHILLKRQIRNQRKTKK